VPHQSGGHRHSHLGCDPICFASARLAYVVRWSSSSWGSIQEAIAQDSAA
jgi:hypothetical protein